MTRRAAMSTADWRQLHAAMRDAGLDVDSWSFYDVDELWKRGLTVDQIVDLMKREHAKSLNKSRT